MDNRTVGVLGGGQLGRMMAEAGHRLGIRLAVVDPEGSFSPAGQIAELSVEGSFQDAYAIRDLALVSDVITVEIEHVNVDILEDLERNGKVVHPNSGTIRIIQDKYQQKLHLQASGIPLPEFMDTATVEEARKAGQRFGYPFMLKNKRLAYDGRGNCVISNEEELPASFEKLGSKDIYAEKWVPFRKEVAVMVARTRSGVVSYPVVETIQKDNICHTVIAPAQISSSALDEAMKIATDTISTFSGIGIYGVELFLLADETVLVNEIAPRPHNSGHYTIEACDIDQFEMHLRAILDLPCPRPTMRAPVAMMINILGQATMESTKELLTAGLSVPGVGMHWYGKAVNRLGRKMAHLTVTAPSTAVLAERLCLLGLDPAIYALSSRAPRVAIIMGSDSDLDTMKDAAAILDRFKITYELTIVSAHRTPTRMYAFAQSAADRGLQVIIAGAGGAAHLPGMVAALTPLPVIGVPVKTSTMNGQDSLLSIVQMPRGVPVATVAIGNAANAGLLAVRILGAQDRDLLSKMSEYLNEQEEEVLAKANKLETLGYLAYLHNAK